MDIANLTIDLVSAGSFIYKSKLDKGLIEHELDHVLFGFADLELPINPNPEQVCEYKWVEVDMVFEWVKNKPQEITPWLIPALKLALSATQE